MDFSFADQVPYLPGSVDSAALGASAGAPFAQADLNKFVKLAANDNYVLAVDGDDIEGVVVAIAPNTVNDGFSFGSVQRRFQHLVCRHLADESAITVGTRVVVGTQAALGTVQDYPVVRAAVASDDEGLSFPFRVKSLLGNAGAAGQLLVIEPLTR